MSGMIDAVVAHGLGAQYGDLPEEARKAVQTYLLDTLGVGIAGAAVPLTARVRAAAGHWADSGTAHVWGQNAIQTTPANAAFINGFQIHCQEFDCVHEPAVVHPLATILSALMAECDAQGGVSGPDLAMAMTVAVDLATGIGISVTSPIKFFRPANAGIFGATLGVSRLRGFTPEQAKDALGYALAFNSGTMQAHVEGKPALPVQIGNAARGAIMACDMAQAGMPGPHDSLEGPFGYFALFEDEADPTEVIASLGKVWRIAEVSHKPFPTGRAAQGGIVLMQKLRAQGVTPENVEHIKLTAPPIIHRLVGRPIRPDMAVNYARLCFQFSGAVALRTGNVGLTDFSEEALRDADTYALGQRIEVVDDGSPDPAAFVPQVARATLKDGGVVEARIDALYGSPADPMSEAAHLNKFRACVDFGFGTPRPDIADQLITLTNNLEAVTDVRLLSRLAAGLEAK
ncbi:MmgE/PrpD family protein [Hyphomonas sp. FCG-A18]|uniref:MmgE/PrpD family protein n=1 Tax=Hyphomonas sp. FCG-A18 TaxID=3080019 RepID=UPI002B2D1ADC|nr:MmgE/PrpD family protein [Hyphomonas sp. FCG-A18]